MKHLSVVIIILLLAVLVGCSSNQTIHSDIPSQSVSTPKTTAHGSTGVKVTPDQSSSHK